MDANRKKVKHKEKLLDGNSVMKDLKTCALFLSTGRTGTMFFAQTLGKVAGQADVYHEAGERSRLINILTNIHLSGFIPIKYPYKAWKRVIGSDLNKCQNEFYIDSNSHIYAFVLLKPNIYPNLKVIHLVRDPRTYVRSHINWARHRIKSFLALYFVPFWQPNGFFIREMSFADWYRFSVFERFCWYWTYKNRTIEKYQTVGVPYKRIRFEDVFYGEKSTASLNEIFNFIGLQSIDDSDDFLKTPINPSGKKTFPEWSEWTKKKCLQLDKICGATMKTYGYGDEPEWIAKLSSRPGKDFQL